MPTVHKEIKNEKSYIVLIEIEIQGAFDNVFKNLVNQKYFFQNLFKEIIIGVYKIMLQDILSAIKNEMCNNIY